MTGIAVRVKTEEQLERVLALSEADLLIVDASCGLKDPERIRGERKDLRVYLQLPHMMRENKADKQKALLETAESFDGIVIRNMDQIGLLKEDSSVSFLPVIGDSFLYAYNSEAISFYRQLFPEMQFILSDELTDAEAVRMMNGSSVFSPFEGFIYKVYGYQPLMITAQCIRKNYHGCKQGPVIVSYTDERKNRFYAAAECDQCMNVIYNGQPTDMLDKLKAEKDVFSIDGTKYDQILLDLTIETGKETEKVLQKLKDILSGRQVKPEGSFTRGHHYKGAE